MITLGMSFWYAETSTQCIQICLTFYWSHLFLWWKAFESLLWFEGKAQFLVCDVIVVEFFAAGLLWRLPSQLPLTRTSLR